MNLTVVEELNPDGQITHRVCKECHVLKSVVEFHYYNSDSPSWKCKPCHVASERKRQKAKWASDPIYRERHNNYGKVVRKGLPPVLVLKKKRGITTICKVCREEKPTEEFPLRNVYRLKTCLICYNTQENLKARKRYQEDTEYRARKVYSDIKSRYAYVYNVTVDEVVNTLTSQNNKCANLACGIEISLTAPKELVKPAMVDHNHRTGKFRSLLCSRCNTLLGHLETNPQVIDGLKDYLIKYNN